jgi:predicted ABC-type transport system involved in lysophospholipase L1 biosynthesis ATPase subunit
MSGFPNIPTPVGGARAPVVEARGLVKSYLSGEKRLGVLAGIDLTVGEGETVGISGESGSGKSTLLNLLAGLDAPDAGAVTWGGRVEMSAARRATYLGMVFQAYYLLPELTAWDNVLLAARMAGGVDRAVKTRATELLAAVGLAERGHHVPAMLSGGERQRVALARALINRPALLVADEPTGNLDERTGEVVIDLLLRLTRETGAALVLVTHNPAHVARCERQLHLHQGRFE